MDKIILPVVDQVRPVTAGPNQRALRMVGGFQLMDARAALATAQATGNPIEVDIQRGGVSLLSGPLTFANGSLTTVGNPSVVPVGGVALADEDQVQIAVLQIGDGSANGLTVVLLGYETMDTSPLAAPPPPPPPPPSGPIDRTMSAQAIGSAVAVGALGNVYDKDPTTDSFSNESGAGVDGVSWSGQHFAAPGYALSSFTVLQGRSTGFTTDECVTSAILEYSSDGVNWTPQQTLALAQAFAVQSFEVTSAPTMPYWRLLANSGVVNGYRWCLSEITMLA